MHTAGHIDLSPKAVTGLAHLRGRLERKDFERFKSLAGFFRSTPVHISEKTEREPCVHISPLGGLPLQHARFAPAVNAQAQDFLAQGVGSSDVLAAYSAGFIGPDLSLLVRKVSEAEAQSIGSFPYGIAARSKAFPLALYTLLSGTSAGGNPFLVGIGRAEFPAASLTEDGTKGWPPLALDGLIEQRGVRLEYSGMAISTDGVFSGRMTVIGLASGPMVLSGDSRFDRPRIGFEKEAVAAMVRSGKGTIPEDLLVALSVTGFREWGPDFLRLADK